MNLIVPCVSHVLYISLDLCFDLNLGNPKRLPLRFPFLDLMKSLIARSKLLLEYARAALSQSFRNSYSFLNSVNKGVLPISVPFSFHDL